MMNAVVIPARTRIRTRIGASIKSICRAEYVDRLIELIRLSFTDMPDISAFAERIMPNFKNF